MDADGDKTLLAPPQQEEQQGGQAIAPPPPSLSSSSSSSASSSALVDAVLQNQVDVTMKSEGSVSKKGLVADGRKLVR